jgi:hypothetical protein
MVKNKKTKTKETQDWQQKTKKINQICKNWWKAAFASQHKSLVS